MCAVEDAEPWKVCNIEHPKARKAWTCEECGRAITSGESYMLLTGLSNDGWRRVRTCLHCDALSMWMTAVCGGYILGNLREELVEHWEEGYADIAFGRLIVAMKHRWHDGGDPVPEGVGDLARRMLHQQVAA